MYPASNLQAFPSAHHGSRPSAAAEWFPSWMQGSRKGTPVLTGSSFYLYPMWTNPYIPIPHHQYPLTPPIDGATHIQEWLLGPQPNSYSGNTLTPMDSLVLLISWMFPDWMKSTVRLNHQRPISCSLDTQNFFLCHSSRQSKENKR